MSHPIVNNSFTSPVIGTDPISKGTFTIKYAFMVWDEWDGDLGSYVDKGNCYSGKILIQGPNNPLFDIAIKQPLRLQGLIASV
jgi:hypothetical protein